MSRKPDEMTAVRTENIALRAENSALRASITALSVRYLHAGRPDDNGEQDHIAGSVDVDAAVDAARVEYRKAVLAPIIAEFKHAG
jgi:hypothetical protein